jgi:hypothetical protein
MPAAAADRDPVDDLRTRKPLGTAGKEADRVSTLNQPAEDLVSPNLGATSLGVPEVSPVQDEDSKRRTRTRRSGDRPARSITKLLPPRDVVQSSPDRSVSLVSDIPEQMSEWRGEPLVELPAGDAPD